MNPFKWSTPQHSTVRRRERGVGLVEILVAVVVLSIGFLAAARMQVHGMRVSQNAYYQSQAYFIISDMVDRMRSNIEGVENARYTDMTTSDLASNPDCVTNTCSDADIANQDLYDWSALLHPIKQKVDVDDNPIGNFVAALPSSDGISARGSITSLGSGIFVVTVFWSETVNGAAFERSLSVNFATEDS